MNDKKHKYKSRLFGTKSLRDEISEAIESHDSDRIIREIMKCSFIQTTLELVDESLLRKIDDDTEKRVNGVFVDLYRAAEIRSRGGEH